MYKLIRESPRNGLLSLKDVYAFQKTHGQFVSWTKLVWNSSIPTSNSLFLCRFMNNKLLTNENPTMATCNLVSKCDVLFNLWNKSSYLIYLKNRKLDREIYKGKTSNSSVIPSLNFVMIKLARDFIFFVAIWLFLVVFL